MESPGNRTGNEARRKILKEICLIKPWDIVKDFNLLSLKYRLRLNLQRQVIELSFVFRNYLKGNQKVSTLLFTTKPFKHFTMPKFLLIMDLALRSKQWNNHINKSQLATKWFDNEKLYDSQMFVLCRPHCRKRRNVLQHNVNYTSFTVLREIKIAGKIVAQLPSEACPDEYEQSNCS